jgi:hypothetical protein
MLYLEATSDLTAITIRFTRTRRRRLETACTTMGAKTPRATMDVTTEQSTTITRPADTGIRVRIIRHQNQVATRTRLLVEGLNDQVGVIVAIKAVVISIEATTPTA